MDEHVVDPGLESFLNKELPETKRPDFKVDDDDIDPGLEKLLNDPITDQTKNQIIQCFLSAFQTSPDTAMKIMHLFKSLDGFTEGEGRDYLEAISQADLATVSFHIITMLLKTLSQYFVNPARPENIKLIVKDPYIRASANASLRKVFQYLGNMSGVLLFTTYAIDSYAPVLITEDEEKSEEDKLGREDVEEPAAKKPRKK